MHGGVPSCVDPKRRTEEPKSRLDKPFSRRESEFKPLSPKWTGAAWNSGHTSWLPTVEARGSSKDRRDDLRRLHAGEFLVEAAVGVDEAVVVDAHLLEDGGVEVAEVGGVLGDVPAEVIGLAVDVAGLDAGAGQPDREAAAVVVAAGGSALRVAL